MRFVINIRWIQCLSGKRQIIEQLEQSCKKNHFTVMQPDNQAKTTPYIATIYLPYIATSSMGNSGVMGSISYPTSYLKNKIVCLFKNKCQTYM